MIASAPHAEVHTVLDRLWPAEQLGPRPSPAAGGAAYGAAAQQGADVAAESPTVASVVVLEYLPEDLFAVDDSNARLAFDGFGAPSCVAPSRAPSA
eukprot:4240011-Prymnesium_polylepis.1